MQVSVLILLSRPALPLFQHHWYQEYITPQHVQRLIQLCVGSWSSGIGSSDVMRTLHTSARPVSRQGTIVFDPRVPATPRVPLRCVRYYDAKIRFRPTKTLHRAGSGVAHSGGLCTLAGTASARASLALRVESTRLLQVHVQSCTECLSQSDKFYRC